MSVMFSISIGVVLICIGVAIDYTIVSKNQNRAQNVADVAALSAAVSVSKSRENPDPSEGYGQGQVYLAEEIGHPFKGLVGKDAEVTFEYHFDDNEVHTKVTGAANPVFSQFIGHKTLPFSANSIAEIPATHLGHPASIALVIDNSNSMWHDQDKSAEWDQRQTMDEIGQRENFKMPF